VPRNGGIRVDPFNLARFVDAQDALCEEARTVFEQACAELRQGGKRSHWMWFIFPQIRGLGFSATAQEFAISGREEAEAYLKHAILGPRLAEATRLVVALEGLDIREIFGYPDYLKFRSCMTLFAAVTDVAAHDQSIFDKALQKDFGGEADPRTLELLGQRA
jgi:uncharacterized protein (DUF1810 family)